MKLHYGTLPVTQTTGVSNCACDESMMGWNKRGLLGQHPPDAVLEVTRIRSQVTCGNCKNSKLFRKGTVSNNVLTALLIGVLAVLLALTVYKAKHLPPPEHEPRIQQQESRQMIKEIHEHLIGERHGD